TGPEHEEVRGVRQDDQAEDVVDHAFTQQQINRDRDEETDDHGEQHRHQRSSTSTNMIVTAAPATSRYTPTSNRSGELTCASAGMSGPITGASNGLPSTGPS